MLLCTFVLLVSNAASYYSPFLAVAITVTLHIGIPMAEKRPAPSFGLLYSVDTRKARLDC